MECGCGMGFFELVICGEIVMCGEFVICGELVMCGELVICGEIVICGGTWRVELTLPCRGCFLWGSPEAGDLKLFIRVSGGEM